MNKRLFAEFEKLVSTHPDTCLKLETKKDDLTQRFIDIVTPVGKGQRALIVAPPKTGKTTILKNISESITKNYPEIIQIVLLINERPEEVTDFKRSVNAEVVASSSDKSDRDHVKAARYTMNKAADFALKKKDIVVLIDSITRLVRTYNKTTNSYSKIMTGGIGSNVMYEPRKFFGLGRNIENGGSITTIATALIDTGSRMDDYIYEEFKGTGNMELVLNRSLAEQRLFPCIDIHASGTRKEELLFSSEEYQAVSKLRSELAGKNIINAYKKMYGLIINTDSNQDLLNSI